MIIHSSNESRTATASRTTTAAIAACVLALYCTLASSITVRCGRAKDELGEGVISAAIAVLIVAGLGALMWVGFRTIWTDAEATTRSKISEIGG